MSEKTESRVDFEKVIEEAEKAKTLLRGLVAGVKDDGEGWGTLSLGLNTVWAFDNIDEAHRLRDMINEALKPVRAAIRQHSEDALQRLATPPSGDVI